MKAIYVVKGSQDGNIGVYGNVKGAYDKCLEYINSGGADVKTSYSQALKGCKGWGCEIESTDDYIKCDIEVHFLNQ